MPYDDNNACLTDFIGLKLVDGIIASYVNGKQEFIVKKKEEYEERIYTIDDGCGIIFNNN